MPKPRRVSDLTKDQYAALGAVACEWSHLEQTLQEILWEVAKVPAATGLKITTELSSVTLLNMILALAHDENEKDPDKQPAIYNAMLGMAEAIHIMRGKRNGFVHGDWFRRTKRPVGIETLRFKAEGKLVGTYLRATVDEINRAVDTIFVLHTKLIQIKEDFKNGRLVASPPKSKRQLGRDRQRNLASLGKTPSSQP